MGPMKTVKNIAIKTLVNGLALWLAAIVVDGIEFGRGAEWTGTLKTVILVALVFGLVNAIVKFTMDLACKDLGLVNAIVKPILKAFATPLIWLTLGLFTLVINALMLQLTSWLADKLTLAFHVQQFFWDAVLGAVIVTFVSMVLHAVIPDPKD